MIDRTTKLRWRRRVRRRQRQLEDIGSTTEEHLDRHFFRRLGRLYEVRRFLLSWVLLIVLLMGATVIQTRALGSYFQTIQPLAGGIYSEGIVGTFTNANPIFATNDVDSAVSRLVFSGLMTYNADNRFVGDLAVSLTPDAVGKVYTAKLRDDVVWHDKVKFTAKDVVFTYNIIQNPDVKSPLFSSWQGIKVEAPDDYTVVFTLPNVLASFPYSLTNGILPAHLLEGVGVSSFRSSLFNTVEPVGTGPFKWNSVEVRGGSADNREQRVSLVPNSDYYVGRPKLNELIIRTFLNEQRMIGSFENGELTAMAGLQEATDEQKEKLDITEHNIPMTGTVMVFLRTTHDYLTDQKVRQALAAATNQQEILSALPYPSIASYQPFLKGMLGYDPAARQQGFDLAKAQSLLDQAGWLVGEDGIRVKGGNKLALNLNTLTNVEYANIASLLQKQWKQAGVELVVSSLDQRELQDAINNRSYAVLLYGISQGLDSDQFAYWHSSQADVRAERRLNFSDYKSSAADEALIAGRTRIDPPLRIAKYKPFVDAWRNDVPAISLYQPRFLYVTRGALYNFNVRAINTPADRFASVQDWMIRTERATTN